MSNENALEQKRQELTASPLFNLAFMPSLLLLPDSLHIYRATDAATRILGYSHNELQQMALYDLLVESREQVDTALERAYTQPPFVLTVRRPDREERILEGVLHRLESYHLLHCSFIDITDTHLARRAIREKVAISPRHLGYSYLRELVCAMSRAFGGAHVYIGRLVEAERVSGVAYAVDGTLRDAPDYPLQGTPCENAAARGYCAYLANVQLLFPNDQELRAIGAESYIGAPLRDSLGRTIGIAWIVHTKPLRASSAVQEVFQLFTTRAAHERCASRRSASASSYTCNCCKFRKWRAWGAWQAGWRTTSTTY
jgi:PAS domain-containing protein